MFKIYDGRDSFYQWDINQKLIVTDTSVTEVHFCNKTDTCSLVCEVYAEGSLLVVDVPNILLQDSWDIRAYAYCEGWYTKQMAIYKVNARTKPADYVYTETEIKTFGTLEEKITEVEMNMAILASTVDTVAMDSQIAMSMASNCIQREEVEQNFNPSGENPISGAGVGQAYFALENMYNELASSQLKWRTIMNTTLTEAQGGTDSLLLELGNGDLLSKAKSIRVVVSFPVAEAKAANAFWTTVLLQDENKKTYSYALVSGYNVKGNANVTYVTTAAVDIFDYQYSNTYKKGFHSIGHLPNPHFQAPANSNVAPKSILGGYNHTGIKNYTPFLGITNSAGVTFEAGTKVYVEVLA